jgi:probable rRNA maturation factor
MNIQFDAEVNFPKGWPALPERALALMLERVGVCSENVEVSVHFVEAEEIRELNRKHRDIDDETDVLSFPQFGSFEIVNREPDNTASRNTVIQEISSTNGIILLGDIVICKEVAARQAEEYGHSETRELLYLFVHSILHLFGWDHDNETERSEMRRNEEEIMAALNVERV